MDSRLWPSGVSIKEPLSRSYPRGATHFFFISNSIFDPLSLRFSKIVASWLATLEPQIGNNYQLLSLKSEILSNFLASSGKSCLLLVFLTFDTKIVNNIATSASARALVDCLQIKFLENSDCSPGRLHPSWLAFHPNETRWQTGRKLDKDAGQRATISLQVRTTLLWGTWGLNCPFWNWKRLCFWGPRGGKKGS